VDEDMRSGTGGKRERRRGRWLTGEGERNGESGSRGELAEGWRGCGLMCPDPDSEWWPIDHHHPESFFLCAINTAEDTFFTISHTHAQSWPQHTAIIWEEAMILLGHTTPTFSFSYYCYLITLITLLPDLYSTYCYS
jgi:hypothetical protein